MKASEAREIVKKVNAMMDWLYDSIRSAAEKGGFSITVGKLSNDQIRKLTEDGYDVTPLKVPYMFEMESGGVISYQDGYEVSW